MTTDNFKIYENDYLRDIRFNLVNGKIDKLPFEISSYINKQNTLIGNENTRIIRCIHLIDEDIIRRFVNMEI